MQHFYQILVSYSPLSTNNFTKFVKRYIRNSQGPWSRENYLILLNSLKFSQETQSIIWIFLVGKVNWSISECGTGLLCQSGAGGQSEDCWNFNLLASGGDQVTTPNTQNRGNRDLRFLANCESVSALLSLELCTPFCKVVKGFTESTNTIIWINTIMKPESWSVCAALSAGKSASAVI